MEWEWHNTKDKLPVAECDIRGGANCVIVVRAIFADNLVPYEVWSAAYARKYPDQYVLWAYVDRPSELDWIKSPEIYWRSESDEKGYHIMIDGEEAHYAETAYERDMFIAEFKVAQNRRARAGKAL